MDTGAITGLTIRVHGPTVPNRFQRRDTVFNNRAAFLTVDRNNQTNTAVGFFIFMIIQTILGHEIALSLFGLYPSVIIFGHQSSPRAYPKGRCVLVFV